eukprot:5155868-Prymnesium_polylepis.1
MLDGEHECASLLQPLHRIVAMDRRDDDAAVERRALAADTEENGATGLVEGVVHVVRLLPGGRVIAEVVSEGREIAR